MDGEIIIGIESRIIKGPLSNFKVLFLDWGGVEYDGKKHKYGFNIEGELTSHFEPTRCLEQKCVH